MRFAVVVHKDLDSSYGVAVPDLPGCISAGDTLDEVFENVVEAILGHVEVLLMDGEPIPQRRPLEEHQSNEDYEGGLCWGYVDVDLSHARVSKKRVNVSLPANVLASTDEAAKVAGVTRSDFLATAALEAISKQRESST